MRLALGAKGETKGNPSVILQLHARPGLRIMHFLYQPGTQQLLGLVRVPRIPRGGLSLNCNLPQLTLIGALWGL